MVQYLKRSWAEIDLDHMKDNIRQIQRLLSPGCQMMGVVKADAYGHGDRYVAQCLREQGVRWFGVSNLEEALSLRRLGFSEEILIFGTTPPEHARDLAAEKITQAVFSVTYAKELSRLAEEQGVTVKGHLKLDTGMGRLGLTALDGVEKTAEEAAVCCRLPNLELNGVFTHFSVADEENPVSQQYTREQFANFQQIVEMLGEKKIFFEIRHCCNSAATLCYPEMHLDMVRPGIVLYGLYPSRDCRRQKKVPLKPVMELKSAVSLVKRLEQGRSVSYGRTYVSPGTVTIATVPIGYADGYPRLLSNRASATVRGRAARVVGNVCMDQLMLDVTGIPGVKEGDLVTLFGSEENGCVTADQLADLVGTINYELVCLLGRRVPRVYLSQGKEIGVADYIRPEMGEGIL